MIHSAHPNRRKGLAATAAGLLLAAGTAQADYRPQTVQAEVLDVQPMVETVEYSVPVEVCRVERVEAPAAYEDYPASTRRSHTPGIVGAVIGGAIGNAVGHKKRNKQVGTVVGALLGGAIGGDISRRQAAERADPYGQRRVTWRTQEVCETVPERRAEERVTGYRVSYAYAGETYTTVMDRDPGRYLDVRVRVTPVS